MNDHTNNRILIIDDNRAIHDDFRKILCPEGGTIDRAEAEFFGEEVRDLAQPVFEIDSAFQGEEGVAALIRSVDEGRPYAMAFVDVRMPPGIDGIETVERLWQHCPELQVVMCTAYSDYSWQEMVSRLGNRDRLLVLKKPFASIEALQLACALTEKWELTRQARERLAETERIVEQRTAALKTANEALVFEMEERHKAEEQLLRAQRLESIGTLASGIAHDLNNMLGPILMGAQLLHGMSDNPNAEMIVSTIEENAGRAASIVKQVLTFARGMDGERATLDVGHLVREMKKIMGETFPKSITLRVESEKGLALVEADATQIDQILLNLCVNARDAMPDGGTLTMGVANFDVDENYASMTPGARAGRFVVVRVRDTGTGIPREVLDKIFDPFFTTKPIGKGTGLGLSTVAGIVRAHGGFINVSSHLGKGTVFEVFLPASDEDAALDESPVAKTAPRGNGELILVVDDESGIREVTSAMLCENGYETLTAADGSEALSLYVSRASDIKAVLTDVIMPVVDGVALHRALRKIDPRVKVIATTGEDEETRRAELSSLGVNAFLTKPFGTDALLCTLHAVLGNGSTAAALA
jgi:signal transduction histidine kinase